MIRDTVKGFLLYFTFFTISYLAVTGLLHLWRPSETILVGVGCKGESFIAVARSESALPNCASIEIHEVRND